MQSFQWRYSSLSPFLSPSRQQMGSNNGVCFIWLQKHGQIMRTTICASYLVWNFAQLKAVQLSSVLTCVENILEFVLLLDVDRRWWHQRRQKCRFAFLYDAVARNHRRDATVYRFILMPVLSPSTASRVCLAVTLSYFSICCFIFWTEMLCIFWSSLIKIYFPCHRCFV